MIERGNFEPLSPKKEFDFKGFDSNVEINCRRVNIYNMAYEYLVKVLEVL
jgi:hypothetical protein